MKKYKQLTRDQRYIIRTLFQEGDSYRKIAEKVQVSASTISREIRRNKMGDVYLAGYSDGLANKRKRALSYL